MEEQEETICRSIDDIIDRYGDMVYRVILQHMRNEADTEDVVQDTFMKIMKQCPVFDHVKKEKAWVLKVAMNTCKDHWKYDRLRRHEELLEHYPANTASHMEFTILPYVKKLPQKYRDVIYLFYYEEYSVKEIAEILDKKEATILTWLNRARKQLKEMLKGSVDFEEV